MGNLFCFCSARHSCARGRCIELVGRTLFRQVGACLHVFWNHAVMDYLPMEQVFALLETPPAFDIVRGNLGMRPRLANSSSISRCLGFVGGYCRHFGDLPIPQINLEAVLIARVLP